MFSRKPRGATDAEPRCFDCSTRKHPDSAEETAWRMNSATYQRRRAAGVCIYCESQPEVQGAARCDACARLRRQRNDQRRDEATASGCCHKCGHPHLSNTGSRCDSCHVKRRDRRQRKEHPPVPLTGDGSQSVHVMFRVVCPDCGYPRVGLQRDGRLRAHVRGAGYMRPGGERCPGARKSVAPPRLLKGKSR